MNPHEREQLNLRKAYSYMLERATKGMELDESLVLKMHSLLCKELYPGGHYRTASVYIVDATHDFPPPKELPRLMKDYFDRLNTYHRIRGMPETLTSLQLAAWSHAEFVSLHPFIDGNGRISRLILNYELICGGFYPVSIPLREKKEYYKLLDSYSNKRDLRAVANYVQTLEGRAIDLAMQRVSFEAQAESGKEKGIDYETQVQRKKRTSVFLDGIEP